MKYLFKISQDQNNDYDTFDSAVVCAENEERAKEIHPRYGTSQKPDSEFWSFSWAATPNAVEATKVGVAEESIEVGTVVCASFNAG